MANIETSALLLSEDYFRDDCIMNGDMNSGNIYWYVVLAKKRSIHCLSFKQRDKLFGKYKPINTGGIIVTKQIPCTNIDL